MTPPQPTPEYARARDSRFRATERRPPRGSGGAPASPSVRRTGSPERSGPSPGGATTAAPRPVRGDLVGFATDLDRTLVKVGDRPTPTARTALREARAMGLRVLLVSGRTYAQLRGFARELGDLDGIVSESGAIVEAPVGSEPTVVGRHVAEKVRRRLESRPDLVGELGDVVVSFLRRDRRRLLEALAGIPIQLVANVDRVTVLPRGVTKHSGIRAALRQLGVPDAPYAAIGDAENDLEMLRGAALSGAVANAVPNIRSAVDYVCRARYELGVMEFVRGPVQRRMTAEPGGAAVNVGRLAPVREPP
jgi:hydroxymethylpyrimidine pyrophosphatase-like HAD family hydrolase